MQIFFSCGRIYKEGLKTTICCMRSGIYGSRVIPWSKVDHILGKDEVTGSNPVSSSKIYKVLQEYSQSLIFYHYCEEIKFEYG